MAKTKGWQLKRGILNVLTGTYNGLVISKKGVLYAKTDKKNKTKTT